MMLSVIAEIFYRKGYKYQLTRDHVALTEIIQTSRIKTEFLDLDEHGMLLIRSGYAWDGPSGPTIDTPSAMRGSLVHDALYQLMRMGLLDRKFRHAADEEFRRRCIEDGMSKFRAWYFFVGVDVFAAKAASAEARKREIRAPVPFTREASPAIPETGEERGR